MTRTRFIPMLTILALGLSGCAAAVDEASEPESSTSPPRAASTPTATATPSDDATEGGAAGEIILTLDGVVHSRNGTETIAPLDDPEAVIALFTRLVGSDAVVEELENPPGYEFDLTRYDWGQVSMLADSEEVSSIAVLSSSLDDLPISATGRIAVGSTVDDLREVDAQDVYDSDGDGVADQIGFAPRDVPGTQSLVDPDAVGSEFFLALVEDDRVVEIQFPGNDFSDI